MAGRRMPEVSAGDFIALFKDLCALSAAKLSLDLPTAVASSRRATFLAEFERGRGYIVFVLAMKNIQLRDAPSVLMALGHHNESVAKGFLEQCLVTASTHPRIVQLQSQAMSEEAVSWLAGESLEHCPNLASFTGSYRFGYSNETPCEAQHAYIGRTVAYLYNRTEAYDSLVLRMPFFRSMMQGGGLKRSSEQVALGLAECLHASRNPKSLLTTLGLQNHHFIQQREDELHPWHVTYREVLYCNDEYTLHHMPTPDIEVMRGPDRLACPRLESDIFLEVQRLAAVADLHTLLTTISCSETMPVFPCQ